MEDRARYVLRDTVMVTGGTEERLATAGILLVREVDPMAGGTGHTIRVCRQAGNPVIVQSEWLAWLKP